MLKTTALATFATLVLTGSSFAQDDKTIYVQTWGGSLGESFQENVVRPFEQATGYKVELSYGMAADALAKVRGQKANPQVDVAMVGQTEAAILWREGLLAPLDRAEIPNLANLSELAVYADGDSIYYAGMYGYVLELIYRTDMISEPVTAWKDLLKPEFAGEVMFSSPAILSAQSQVMMARAFGGDERNMEPGWTALKELAPNLSAVYRSDAETYNLIASGEAAIGPALMYTTLELQKAGIPVARVTPAEGSPISWDGISLVKDSPNPEGAKALINFMLSLPAIEAHVNAIGTIPAADGVTLSPELAAALPSTSEERSKLLRLDDDAISQFKADWISIWDRQIVPLMN